MSIKLWLLRRQVRRLAERQRRLTIFENRTLYENHLSRFPLHKNIRYTDDQMTDIPMRWLHPQHPINKKVILFFHGGSMCMGSIKSHSSLASYISAKTSMTCVLPKYRLSPEHPFPAAIDDACQIYRYLLSQGYHGEDIAICADSGGGLLAVNVAIYARENQLPMPQSLSLLAPALCTDLVEQDDAYQDLDERDPVLSLVDLRRYSHAYLGNSDPEDPRASPLYADLSDLPPTLHVVGSEEMILDQIRQFHIRSIKAGVQSRLIVEKGCFHAHYLLASILPEANKSLNHISDFIVSQFNSHK